MARRPRERLRAAAGSFKPRPCLTALQGTRTLRITLQRPAKAQPSRLLRILFADAATGAVQQARPTAGGEVAVHQRNLRWWLVTITFLLGAFVLPNTSAAAQLHEDDNDGAADGLCPRQLHRRSTEQVLEAHFAALRSGNAALIACDYAKRAVFMMPGTVIQGREAIQATYAGLLKSAGVLNSLTLTSLTTERDTVLLTYALDSEHIVVSAGVDTFVIEKGRIVLQTVVLGGFATR